MVPVDYGKLLEEGEGGSYRNGIFAGSGGLLDDDEARPLETELLLPAGGLFVEEGQQAKGAEPLKAALKMPRESAFAMALQILLPFLLAGFGTVSVGMVLDMVQVRLT